MSKSYYLNANVVPTYDTFAGWLNKTNQIVYDMGNFVMTTSNTSNPDVTSGNAYVNGFFGTNTSYVTTALRGGTGNTSANLSITSGLVVANQVWTSANVTITGSANVSANVNASGVTATNITANVISTTNLSSIGTLSSNNLTSANAVLTLANVTTANVATLGVTTAATIANLSVGVNGANVQVNTSQITVSGNATTFTSINSTSFSGTANNSTNFGGLSLATVQGQITGNATTAYTNAVVFASNASNINTGTLANARLSTQVVNTSAAFTITGVHTHNANVVIAGNSTSGLLIGTGTSNLIANSTDLILQGTAAVGAFDANTTVVTVGNSTVYTTVNSTAFSGTSNNSINLGGINLATVQSQITGNAATAYTNATAFASNASNISTGTLPNARLAAEVVNTSAAFTITGVHTYNANVVVTGNSTSSLQIGNTASNIVATSTGLTVQGNSTVGAVTSNSTVVTVGNSTVFTTINSTSFSGTANNSTNLGGINLATVQSQITGNASASYTNAVVFASNASNINTGTLANARLSTQVVNTSAAFTITGVHTYNANVVLTGNATSTLLVGTGTSNLIANSTDLILQGNSTVGAFDANSTVVAVGNATVFTTVNSTAFSGTANNATNLGGINLATVQSQITGNASSAYTNATNFVTTGGYTVTGNLTVAGNATSVLTVGNTTANVVSNSTTVRVNGNTTVFTTINSTAFSGTSNNSTNFGGLSLATVQGQITGNAATAYTNAAAYADTKSGAAYSNAVSYADTKAATAYSNATSYADTKAATAYSNATSYADTKSGTAYSNAVAFANAAVTNGAWVAANASYAANAGALGGVSVNMASPTDGYVIAYDAGTSKLVFKNPSNISVALNANTVVANLQLQAGSNGTAYVANVYGNSTVTTATFRANTIVLTVDSGAISLNSSVVVSGTLYNGNSTANTQVNSSVFYVSSNSTTFTTINSTAFSGTANNATYLNNTTLSTIQSQITSNASAAYTNAVAVAASDATSKAATAYTNAVTFSANASNLGNGTVPNARLTAANTTTAGIVQLVDSVTNTSITHAATPNSVKTAADSATAAYSNATTFASNASNITTGTLAIARIPAGVVNTSGSFTFSGVQTFNANVTLAGNSTSVATVGNSTIGVAVNSTSVTLTNSGNVATFNATSFSRQANGATYLGPEGSGVTLSTIQTQINSAYTNSVSDAAASAAALYFTKTGGLISGDVTVSGDLNITGTTFYANVTNLDVKDINITVAKGAASNAASDGAGLTVDVPNAQFFYSASANSWAVNRSFTPNANVTFNIGNTTNFWNSAFVTTINLNGTSSINATTFTGTSNNSTNFGGLSLATVQGQITGNAATAYSNAVAAAASDATSKAATAYSNATAYADTKAGTAYSNAVATSATDASSKADTAYSNAVATAASDATTKADTAYTNATVFASNASNINTGTLAYARLPANVVFWSNTNTFTAPQTFNANAIITGNATAQLIVGTSTDGVNVTSTTINTGNSTVFTTVNSTAFSGTSNNSTNFGGLSLATVQDQITGNAATAYTNAVAAAASDATTKAGTAYSNAVATAASDATTKAGTAYSNAVATAASDASSKAATAYSNAVATAASDATTKAGTAYTNATVFASNASNINTGTLAFARLPANVVFWSNNNTFTGTQTFNANVTISGNTTALLTVGTAADGVDANSSVISIGNATVYTTINSTAFSGTANNSTNLGGSSLATVQGQITGNAATAYTNAVATAASDASSKAATAYSNAVAAAASDASTKAGTAYSNAIVFASNASNINSGSLAYARLPAAVVNTSSNFTLSGVITFAAGMFEKYVDLGVGSAINLNSGTYFSKTITGATSFTTTNVPAAGVVASFTLELTNAGSNTITWMTGTKWADGSPPTFTDSGMDVLVFTTRDGGSTWLGAPSILNAA